MNFRKIILSAFVSALFVTTSYAQQGIWPAQKANDWYAQQGWLRGCNFQPSTAINQLEMFQPDTFDTATINKELDGLKSWDLM